MTVVHTDTLFSDVPNGGLVGVRTPIGNLVNFFLPEL